MEFYRSVALNVQIIFWHRAGCTPLHQAVSNVIHDINPIHQDVMRLIINSKADPNKFWESETVLHTAIRQRNKDVVGMLLDANANVNLKCESALLSLFNVMSP
jgi:ankyrin repeat protein